MILVSIFGGLGNQMFQYATAKALAKRLGVELKLDIQHVNDRHYRKDFTYKNYELCVFEIKEQIATIEEVRGYIPNLWNTNKFILQLYRLKRIIKGRRLYHEKQKFTVERRIFSIKNNTYLYGYFQSAGYFEHIREDLLSAFKLNYSPNKENSLLISQINTENSVSIHIRRGDYIQSIFAILDMDNYYQKAIQLICEQVVSPSFYIFTNDYDWAFDNFEHLPIKKRIVQINKTEEEAHMDMILMSHCKHNICANSSFSWWGAWLNQHSEKIVIAPQLWLREQEENIGAANGLIPEKWIKI